LDGGREATKKKGIREGCGHIDFLMVSVHSVRTRGRVVKNGTCRKKKKMFLKIYSDRKYMAV